MGGIKLNTRGQVRSSADGLTDGLYAAGECACVSVHGANRLGSNSLLECVVYGKLTGAAIAEDLPARKALDIDEEKYIEEAKVRIQGLLDRQGGERIDAVRQDLQDCMSEHCSVFRTDEVMSEGLAKLQAICERAGRVVLDDRSTVWNTELIEAMEIESLVVVAQTILNSALQRQESRGAHSREDFPDRDDPNFLKHTLAYYSPAGVEIRHMPVALGMFEPKERKY